MSIVRVIMLITTAIGWGASFVILKLITLWEPEGAMEADMGTKEKAPVVAAAPAMMSVKNKNRLPFIVPPL